MKLKLNSIPNDEETITNRYKKKKIASHTQVQDL